MKQPHTEGTVVHTGDEQNTGNHKLPDAPDAQGADRFGGTRAGSENVEKSSNTTESTQSGPDIERLRPLDEGPTNDVTGASGVHAERAPERDERGRL
jgi:hypothetical protein